MTKQYVLPKPASGKLNRKELLAEYLTAGIARDAFPAQGLAVARLDGSWHIDCERALTGAEQTKLETITAAHDPEHGDEWADEVLAKEVLLANAYTQRDSAKTHKLDAAEAHWQALIDGLEGALR